MPLNPPEDHLPPRQPAAMPTISWFPGHMHKAQKRLAKEIKQIDVVLEMRDARLPLLSANPELEALVGSRKRLLLFNKATLADPGQNARWKDYFQELAIPALFLDADGQKGVNLIYPIIRELCEASLATFRKRGIRPPLQRLMVTGMPNVGKSTLINRMIRHKRLKTAPTPGVTRGISWVNLKGKYLLMDTPGVMLPRLDRRDDALRLGWVGTIRDKIIGAEQLAEALLDYLLSTHPKSMARYFGLTDPIPAHGRELLEWIGKKRGNLRKGGLPDLHHTADSVLSEYRKGKLGRFTLQSAPQ